MYIYININRQLTPCHRAASAAAGVGQKAGCIWAVRLLGFRKVRSLMRLGQACSGCGSVAAAERSYGRVCKAKGWGLQSATVCTALEPIRC